MVNFINVTVCYSGYSPQIKTQITIMEINQPKRILSLDGGGIRGALTLGFLESLESIIREKENNKDLLLYDYFDLIGGASTGAIIAAGLSQNDFRKTQKRKVAFSNNI
jgi:patatin-like phospholipase/acyl hydrolase